jgi:hypothetical protein
MRSAIIVGVAALITATMVLVGASTAQARCVTVGADSVSQKVCGLP